MRAVVQRVSTCFIDINGVERRNIDKGFLVLLGIEQDDDQADIQYLVQKIINLRIFGDEDDKMNLSLQDIGGSMMVVSQFTLFASTRKGNRPSFIRSAKPDIAIPLYNQFIDVCKNQLQKPGILVTGEFGADMNITFTNNGPVTIIIDSKIKE